MGVVRREGDWRLEKREEGVYEITYEKETREVVFTPEYSLGIVDEYAAVAVPTATVDSYAEAEGLFEERAHSTQSPQMSMGAGQSSQGGGLLDMDAEMVPGSDSESVAGEFDALEDAQDLPPGGIALVLVAAGGLFLWSSEFAVGSTVFGIGALFLVGGLVIFGWAFLTTDDVAGAVSYLGTVQNAEDSSPDTEERPEKTPPTPESLKHDLLFDRAEQACEWCDDGNDHLEVHHIQPRSEGGPNTRQNLIVLCPNCHRKADSGALSRSKLQGKVRRLQDA